MTDALLERVSRIEHVTALRLDGSRELTDAGLCALSRMPQLRQLDLSGCAVGDRGLEVLSELPALETIGLAWTGVTDAGAAHLARCQRLRRVDLQGTRSGDGAIAALADKPALSHFKSGALVTGAGLAALHHVPVFKSWQGGETEMALTSIDAEPNSVLLRGSFTGRDLDKLQGLDGLFALNLYDDALALDGPALAPLVGLKNLGWLAAAVGDDAMATIAAMPRLRFLMCQDTPAGDDGFTALSRSRSIEYIWGRRCHNLRGRGFRALAQMPALRALSVSCKNVVDDALSSLPQFPALRELMPIDVPDAGFRHIGRCQALESLVLMYCRETTDAATEHITGLEHLKSYFASYTRITDRSLELLGTMASLERIELSACPGVTNAGVAALARLSRLRALRLSGMQNVTQEAAASLPPHVRLSYST
jgi:hypothetical protein